jgi:N-acetylglucosamine malate deacetylase 1
VPDGPQRVVIVAPHPDDESIGCGGTIAAHVAAGDDVTVVFLSSGEAGHPTLPREEFRPIREREAAAAAAVLGVRDLRFWRLPDGAIRSSAAAVSRMADELRGAETVYVTNPREMHVDHRAAARLVRAAVAQLDSPPRVLAYEVWTPLTEMSEIVDIGAHIATKLAAIREHRSQCELVDFAAAAEGLARYRGEMFSWPEGDYAEVFAELTPVRGRRRAGG